MNSNRAETLEQLARLCRTGRGAAASPAIESTEFAELDSTLPGGGWPIGTIVELIPVVTGIGELRLLLPTLARITRTEHHVALISPPYIPFAPALAQHGMQLERLFVINAQAPADTLWAFEQTLRCKSFGAVVAWPSIVKDREVRRLQLAAEAGHSIGFLYRPPSAALESSPAAVRLKFSADKDGHIAIEILKCRGGRSGFSVAVSGSGLAADATALPSATAPCVALPPASMQSSPVKTGEGKTPNSVYPLSANR